MAKLLKAMKRPAALWGANGAPAGCHGCNHHRCYLDFRRSPVLTSCAISGDEVLTRNEPMRFNLIAVWLRAKGKPVANRLFGATTFMPVEHDDVDIKEFLDAMKLNQCATIKKYIPYSSHIHQHVVRSPKSDLYCTGIDGNAVRLRV